MSAPLSAILFPATPRRIPCERGINIALRTAHLMTSGLLLGGHAFNIAPHRLILLLYLTLASGAGMILLELYSSCRWIYLGKGVIVGLKVLLLLAAGVWWEQRLAFLLLVVLVGSVGSHMPARFRYYSLLHRRALVDPDKVPAGAPVSTWRQ
ncbi:MAG: hypothetical protein HY713_00450 [candidate division NC10 bacterium]|nr:hypothetical protein [candidate division NC10 bacterium]